MECRGIIPARAGFTDECVYDPSRVADHPRSRGVYAVDGPVLSDCRGSSPLARGLRHKFDPPEYSLGIIPARAGFTCASCWRGHPQSDHPRSRGVYDLVRCVECPRPGSSPLARGLLVNHFLCCNRRRIIPARAGFTRLHGARGAVRGDHPRSRGVYLGMEHTLKSLSGSSPLARGLRPPGRPWAPGRRIIPARAGFTARA